MNAFLKKEIRLLLPNFGFACVLAVAWAFFPNNQDNLLNSITWFLGCIFCPAVAVMLALSSFGIEMGSGTFANLLAQPMPRQKIWETKIKLLAMALLGVAFLWVVSFLFSAFYFGRSHGINDWLDLFTAVSLTGLVIFSGGLWTVLLLRQVAAAFWFTLIVPGAVVTILAGVLAGFDEHLNTGIIAMVLGIYSLAGFFFARWLFFRAQDLQWSGGNIEMPELRGLARFKAAGALRQWRPRAALWRKEIMLHQSQLVMAFVLLVLHGGVLVARHFVDKHRSPELYFVLEIFWGLWFVLPLLVGCAAVAEERKLGTLGAQLCLPVKKRTQFVIKLLVVLGLSVMLGAMMPLLLEGTRILPGTPFEFRYILPSWWGQIHMSNPQIFFWESLRIIFSLIPVFLLAGIAALIGLVSFYASSLSRNTLQSLAPAVLGLLLIWFLIVLLVELPFFRHTPAWRGPLAFFILIPLLLVALVWLLFKNFQLLQPGWKIVARNFGVLLGALLLGGALTSAVYNRFWEKFTPFEPAHGLAKLSAANPAQVTVWWAETSVRLPDGRIWRAPFLEDPRSAGVIQQLLGNVRCKLGEGTFYAGSNWLSVRRYGREVVGVKADGTLWISEAPMPATSDRRSGLLADDQKMRNLQPFGNETNWASANSSYQSTLLIKTDGTLWRLGTNRFPERKMAWPGLRAFTPYQLGADADWSRIDLDYNQFVMVKNSGSIWMQSGLNGFMAEKSKNLEIEPGFTMAELYDGSGGKFRNTTQIRHELQYKVGIREDGTFRIWSDMRLNPAKRKYEFIPTDRQIGSGSNWVALAGGNSKVVTLKNDGTLWLWDFTDRNPWRGLDEKRLLQQVEEAAPMQLGSHSDWIAISGEPHSLVALAADGSLWFWPLENAEYSSYGGEDRIRPLLNTSRKPQLLGNIFAQAK